MRGRTRKRPWEGPVGWLIITSAAFALMTGVYATQEHPVKGLASLTMMPLLVGVLVAFIMLLIAFGQMGRARYHVARRAKGKLTPEERELEAAWAYARDLRETVLRKEIPPVIHTWDVVPSAGEVFFVDGVADYARYYGQDVTYTQSGGFWFGHPLFVAAGLAATAIGNASARSRARALAAEQWRERQRVRLLVSNQRLVCLVRGRWLSFWFSGTSSVQPVSDEWALFCQFPDVEPLMLSGFSAPAAAVIAVLQTHGVDGVARHPGLQALGQSQVAIPDGVDDSSPTDH